MLAPSSKYHFDSQDKKDKIMFGIFELLKIDDDDILHSALEALVEIIKVNFIHMSNYLNDFYEIS